MLRLAFCGPGRASVVARFGMFTVFLLRVPLDTKWKRVPLVAVGGLRDQVTKSNFITNHCRDAVRVALALMKQLPRKLW